MGNPNPAKIEIVCDKNGFVCNAWRAIGHDPEAVSYWADYPTIHQDLTARHQWLKDWHVGNNLKLSEDVDFYDVKVAGWWIWGMSIWIGGGFCSVERERMPLVEPSGGGQGVSKQRGKMPKVNHRSGGQGISKQRDQLPHVKTTGGGQGVSKQRDKRPYVRDGVGGRGVSRQRDQVPAIADDTGGMGISKQRLAANPLIEWFEVLNQRMERVVVLNRDWKSAVTPTVLADTRTSRNIVRAVFLDPPYITQERSESLYQSDVDGKSSDIATEAYEWAVEHGDKTNYRIAYCCHEGDFEVPEGWMSLTQTFGGINKVHRRSRRDLVMFSPGCEAVSDPQMNLF